MSTNNQNDWILCKDKIESIGGYKDYYKYIDWLSLSNACISLSYFELDILNPIGAKEHEDKIINDFSSLIYNMKNLFDLAFKLEKYKFIIVSNELRVDLITTLANQIKHSFELTHRNTISGEDKISISIGVSISRPDESLNDCVRRADRSLYLSKNQSSGVLVFSK
ncbi:MAG: diguanylate cyclase [Erysipelotrichaceae bacterium]|nr:diguanylate cyclase [Erysipelotrichaceae bacterium]